MAIVVPTIVLCELVWVLKRAYRYAGPEIISILRRLVAIRPVEIERPAAEAGIAMLARGGDFADGVVRHEADRAKCDRLVTFDPELRPTAQSRQSRASGHPAYAVTRA
jgi:predicted nucleic-acid-binding protein